MKTKFQITQKSGARFVAGFVVAIAAGSTLAACSNSPSTAPAENVAPAAMEGHAPGEHEKHSHEEHSQEEHTHEKTSASKTYRDIGGRIVSINEPAKNIAGAKTTVTLDHEEIPDFMRAMRMTIPLQNPADAKKLKKDDKIRCDFVMENGSLMLTNIRVLPADTKLKLAPA